MTQPPDDRHRPPGDEPIDPTADQPTVAWTPPADATPPRESVAPTDPPPPDPFDPPVPPAEPAPEPPPVTPTAPIPPQPSPLISASPSPTGPGGPGTAWAAPTSTAAEIAPGLVLSDTVSRVAGYLVDAVIIGIVSSLLAPLLGLTSTIGTGGLETLTADFGYSVLTVAIGFVYFVVSWTGGRRASLGQRLFQIQVGNAFDGRPLTFEQAVRRWLGYGMFLTLFSFDLTIAGVAGLLQFVWVIVLFITTVSSPTKQGLHDKLANTALVRPATAGRGLAWGCIGVLVVLGVLAIVALFALGAALLDSPEFQDLLRQALEQA